MKTLYSAKTLVITAMSCMALTAGIAQAHDWHGHNPYHPVALHVAPQPDFAARPARIDDIDLRQARQAKRIHAGLENGQLSRHEARDLLFEQRKIERTQRRYLADGHLSRWEWNSLDRMLDEASRDIRREKHDRNGR